MNPVFSAKCEVNLRGLNSLKRKERIFRNKSCSNEMSTKTKDFIKKICYRKTASIDMTQYGFINDIKLHPVNLLMKPLRAQLEKICGKPPRNASSRRNSQFRKKVKLSSEVTATTSVNPPTGASYASRTLRSVLSSPGNHKPHSRVRKVRIQSHPSPITGNKKVKVVLPGAKGKKK